MEKTSNPIVDEDQAEKGLGRPDATRVTLAAGSDTEGSHDMTTEKPPAANAIVDGAGAGTGSEWDWTTDPANPYNWPSRKKILLMSSMSMLSFTVTLGSTIIAPANASLTAHFAITSPTTALLPLSLYVFALSIGPIVGGPLSETIGRRPVLALAAPMGTLLALGAGFSPTLAGVVVLRFLAGLVFAPALAIPAAIVSEVFVPRDRGLPSMIFILFAFLGPAVGPVIGGYVVRYGGWQWTQYVLAMFGAVASLAVGLCGGETYHPVLLARHARRHASSQGETATLASEPAVKPLGVILTNLFRPLAMLILDPLVTFTSLFTATQFGTLYILFASAPTIFARSYALDASRSGLTFVFVILGCLAGAFTLIAIDVLLYRRALIPRHAPLPVPPEHRLWPAMLSAWGPPAALFWFGWEAAKGAEGSSWASPAAAMGLVAWGNLCGFVATMQYLADSYGGGTLASAASANSVARYVVAGALALVASLLYAGLGVKWGTGLLGFVSLALMPVPWVFWKWGGIVRKRSRFGVVVQG